MSLLGFSMRFWVLVCFAIAFGAVAWLRHLGKRGPLGNPWHRLIGASAGISLIVATVFLMLRAEQWFAWSNGLFLAIPFLIMGGASTMVVYRMLFAGRATAERDLQEMMRFVP